MNIIIRLQQQHGSWVAAKAASKVYQLGDSREDKEIKRSTRWNKGTWVVQVEQYDEDTANPDSSTNSTMFCLGKQQCMNWLCDCGVNADHLMYRVTSSIGVCTRRATSESHLVSD